VKAIRTERHIFVGREDLDGLCKLSKNLYNYTNYWFSFCWDLHTKLPSYYQLDKWYREEDHKDYRGLPAKTSQQIVKLVEKNWKSYLKALKGYELDPSKFNSKPKQPWYKKEMFVVPFSYQQVSLKDEYIYFPKLSNLEPIKTQVDNIKQVRVVPRGYYSIVEIVYEKEIKKNEELNEDLYLGLDLGVNNLCALSSNKAGSIPILVNGKIVKSINQHFNKLKAKLQSFSGLSKRIKHLTFRRNNKIDNFIHHTSKFIIDYCIENRIGNIIIGYNERWKDRINIGKVNNQKFVQIPFFKLISQIRYKGEEVGIKVQTIEESYTSRCDALALEPIEEKERYLGKRVKRGQFKSSVRMLINADVNGSLNILRKVIGNDFISLINKSCVSQPVRVNPLQSFP
jgi:putative transposase